MRPRLHRLLANGVSSASGPRLPAGDHRYGMDRKTRALGAGSTSRRGSNQAGLHSRNVPTWPEERGAIRPIRAVLPPTPAYWPGLAGSVSMPVTVELMAFGSDRLD